MNPNIDLKDKTAEELENLKAFALANRAQKVLDLAQIEERKNADIARKNADIAQIPTAAQVQKDGKNREIAQIDANVTAIEAAIDALE